MKNKFKVIMDPRSTTSFIAVIVFAVACFITGFILRIIGASKDFICIASSNQSQIGTAATAINSFGALIVAVLCHITGIILQIVGRNEKDPCLGKAYNSPIGIGSIILSFIANFIFFIFVIYGIFRGCSSPKNEMPSAALILMIILNICFELFSIILLSTALTDNKCTVGKAIYGSIIDLFGSLLVSIYLFSRCCLASS
uniref:MARVEL domain-containing protein n=1 Tax=Parastrongyloides trichosuri TaxID=131310 RepID=A0A0N4ZD39_PARTI